MEDVELELADMNAWEEFAANNRDALLEAYPTLADAYKAACDGGLVIGGGAAPLVRVYFAP